jgi:hypothetical protein
VENSASLQSEEKTMRNMPQWKPELRLTFLLTLALTLLVAFDSSAPRHSSAAAPEPLQTPSPTQSPTASPTPEKLSASPAEIVFTAADKDKSFTVKKSDQTEIVIDDNWECKPTDDIAICQKGNNNKFKITSQKSGVTTIKVTYKKEPQKYETLSVKVMIP